MILPLIMWSLLIQALSHCSISVLCSEALDEINQTGTLADLKDDPYKNNAIKELCDLFIADEFKGNDGVVDVDIVAQGLETLGNISSISRECTKVNFGFENGSNFNRLLVYYTRTGVLRESILDHLFVTTRDNRVLSSIDDRHLLSLSVLLLELLKKHSKRWHSKVGLSKQYSIGTSVCWYFEKACNGNKAVFDVLKKNVDDIMGILDEQSRWLTKIVDANGACGYGISIKCFSNVPPAEEAFPNETVEEFKTRIKDYDVNLKRPLNNTTCYQLISTLKKHYKLCYLPKMYDLISSFFVLNRYKFHNSNDNISPEDLDMYLVLLSSLKIMDSYARLIYDTHMIVSQRTTGYTIDAVGTIKYIISQDDASKKINGLLRSTGHMTDLLKKANDILLTNVDVNKVEPPKDVVTMLRDISEMLMFSIFKINDQTDLKDFIGVVESKLLEKYNEKIIRQLRDKKTELNGVITQLDDTINQLKKERAPRGDELKLLQIEITQLREKKKMLEDQIKQLYGYLKPVDQINNNIIDLQQPINSVSRQNQSKQSLSDTDMTVYNAPDYSGNDDGGSGKILKVLLALTGIILVVLLAYYFIGVKLLN